MPLAASAPRDWSPLWECSRLQVRRCATAASNALPHTGSPRGAQTSRGDPVSSYRVLDRTWNAGAVRALMIAGPTNQSDRSPLVWETTDDLAPGPGQILVRTQAAGVNRADLLQRAGHYPPPPGASPILGLEAGGIIEAVGDGVPRWRPGDQVVALLAGGGYAERFVVPSELVLPVPAGLDVVQATSLVEAAATVVSNFDQVGLGPDDEPRGQSVLVHGGSGGVGSFAIAWAAALGCRVLAAAGSAAKLEHCRQRGADVALNYHDDWVEGVRRATDGRGVDVILDVVGAKYLDSNLAALAIGGRLVVIGMQGGVRGELDLATLLAKRAMITATGLRTRPLAQKAAIVARLREQVWPMLESGRITPPPITTFAMPDADAAHRELASGRVIGKLVLTLP